MKSIKQIPNFSLTHPKLIIIIIFIISIIIASLSILPSIWPENFSFLHPLKVDTDPENMLPENEPVRIFHNNMKKEFSLNEIIVVGIVNEKNKNGVFNPLSLKNIFELATYSKTLQWENKEGKKNGVIAVDIIAPNTVDNIEQGDPGEVKFEWLMQTPPTSEQDAIAIREKAKKIPFLNGTLLSENGKAICLYLPLTSKDVSFKVYSQLQEKIKTFKGDDQYHITGLPVANDTFGVEMFKQMALSAPIAMLVIFLLMLYFFKKLTLIISPLMLAFISVVFTMGLLIITGNTVHIMSSMIPIFIMPIAVLDSVHILSEFFDRYPKIKDRKQTVIEVMEELFMPMLYTSLTSMAGFISLALTPIPPVQVFGIFIGIGVMFAWLLTITFIPAYIMLIPEKSLSNFGMQHSEHDHEKSGMTKRLSKLGLFTYKQSKLIIFMTVIVIFLAAYGISKIKINDNPVKWFTKSHPIRIADKELNKHFGGTYMAYLSFEGVKNDQTQSNYNHILKTKISTLLKKQFNNQNTEKIIQLLSEQLKQLNNIASQEDLTNKLDIFIGNKMDSSSDEEFEIWDEALNIILNENNAPPIFKQPEVLKYISNLQTYLKEKQIVGKSNSVSDVVKTVHRELFSGQKESFKIPETPQAVAQCFLTYQNSHRPQDLWHFVTPDYQKTSLWIQLKSGNNKDMIEVVDLVDDYIKKNPPPIKLQHQWFGLTYINVVWQKKMVAGMMKAFLGSFLVVFLMMTILFKSSLWALLSMIPLTVTISFIYGAVGIIGKDYDMPIAVLSSLTLGLAVDFAIHFLARSKELKDKDHTWENIIPQMFDEPARAISRNIIVIALGFTPLLAAPLMPYKTVGIFLATILTVAGLATLFILPALITIMEKKLFPKQLNNNFGCNCITCIISAITLVLVIFVNFQEYVSLGLMPWSVFSLLTIVILAFICKKLSQSKSCKKE